MISYPLVLQKLIREFSKLPSIGEKSANRLAYHIVANDRKLANSLAEALLAASKEMKLCKTCFFLTDRDECEVCENPNRDRTLVCVVEKPMDVVAIERVGEYRGVYHVIHGVWAPLRGQGEEDLKLSELMARVKSAEVQEVILATSSTVEGDATALYIAKMLAEVNVKASRIAQGIPKGAELEYADDVTLSRAMHGRNFIG